MAKLTVSWEDSPGVKVETEAGLDALLDGLSGEVPQDRPIIVELVGPAGDLLSMGVGADESLLNWVPASEEPPYLASVGDPRAEGSVVFYHFGTWSEFPRTDCIPVERARRAAREFLRTGALPRCVVWVET